LEPVGKSHVADRLHRSDLSGHVDLMPTQNQAGAICNSFFNSRGNFIEVLRRNGSLNQLELEAFSLLPLTERGQHARIILGGGENFVTRLEVHPHQKNLE